MKQLILVNKDHAIGYDFVIEKTHVTGKYYLDESAAVWLKKMIRSAKSTGINLKIVSAYRSPKYQQKLFQEDLNHNINNGCSYSEAFNITYNSIAMPFHSEHNTGLAVDLLSDECNDLTSDFDKTKAFAWLSENCDKFGYILRYPKGKENITKIIYEPWHYRYVGVNHASKIKKLGVTLEEYLDKINLE